MAVGFEARQGGREGVLVVEVVFVMVEPAFLSVGVEEEDDLNELDLGGEEREEGEVVEPEVVAAVSEGFAEEVGRDGSQA